jgi:hypothetical protein
MAGSFFMVAALAQFAEGNSVNVQILFAKFNFFLGVGLICKTIEDKKESS